jgi:hypothetical protein
MAENRGRNFTNNWVSTLCPCTHTTYHVADRREARVDKFARGNTTSTATKAGANNLRFLLITKLFFDL